MPGVIGGIVSAICCASLEEANFGGAAGITSVFLARDPIH